MNNSTILLWRRVLAATALLLCFSPSISIGQTVIDTDFNDNPALNLFGAAQLTNEKGGVDGAEDNYIKVTNNVAGERGSIVFDDPTGGFPITGFRIRADLRVGGGTLDPADGFSFNLVRPGDPLIGSGEGYAASPTGEANLPEEGSTTGLGIGFDEWFSGGTDTIGFSVRLDDAILQEIPLPTKNGAVDDATSLQTGPLGPGGASDDSLLGWAQLEIVLAGGNLIITWKGTEVFNGPVNWTPGPGQIVLGGRTGGSHANHHMDNLLVEVTGDELAAVIATRSGVDFFELDVQDVGTSILDPGTISLTLDGNDVSGGLTVNKVGNVTTIRHDQSPQWLFGATIPFEFDAEDTIGQVVEHDGTFRVRDADILANTGLTFVEFTVTDVGASVIDPGTIIVTIDGNDVTGDLVINKVGSATTIRHNQNPQFAFGSTVDYALTSQDNFGQDLNLAGSFMVAQPFFPFEEDLIGADPAVAEAGEWAVRYIFNAGTISPFDSAIGLIQQAAADPDNFLGTIVDVSEPEMNHDGTGGGIIPGNLYHPDAVAAGCCADDFIVFGTACMKIEEAGDYTIGVHSDDGFGCRVHGFNFTDINGAGAIDPISSDTFLHFLDTGDSNTRVIARNVQPGIYRIEFFWWERAGGDHGEIYIAKGAFANDGDTADWLPIGRIQDAGDFGIPGFDASGVDVTSVGPAFATPINNIAEAEAALAAGPTVLTNHDFLNFNDPQSGGPGRIPGDIPFPIDTGADDEDHALSFEATLVIPQTGTYNIGFQGDDGGFIRIPGQTFTSIVENATATAVIDEGGARLLCDCLTGNSSTVGSITLAAGSHPMTGVFFERGGGSYFEVFGVEAGGSANFLIEKDGARTEALPVGGVGLVSKATGIQMVDVLYDALNDEFTVAWTVQDGETYGLFYSLDLSDWGADLNDSIAAAEPNGDPLASYDSETGIITYGPFGNPDPSATKIFFRAQEN